MRRTEKILPMPKLIKMPKLSDTMTEGRLAKWHIKEGDKITMGQAVADVETDKATMEAQAFETGIVHKLVIPEGGKVPLGGGMVVLLDKGEKAPPDIAAYVTANSDAAPKKPEAPAASAPSAKPSDEPKRAFSGTLPPRAPSATRRVGVASN